MADERRKGPPARRPRAKPAQAGEQSFTPAGGTPDVHGNEQARAQNPSEAAAFDADQLDASIRAREQEPRGEVF